MAETDEIQAYDELYDYLIKNEKYSNTVEADNDAGERVYKTPTISDNNLIFLISNPLN